MFCCKIDGNKISIVLNFFDVISKFFSMFYSMFYLSILCLFYIFAFLCFVVLCFVIDLSQDVSKFDIVAVTFMMQCFTNHIEHCLLYEHHTFITCCAWE